MMKRYVTALALAILGGAAFLLFPDTASTPLHAQFSDPCAVVLASTDSGSGLRSALQAARVVKPPGLDPDPRGRHLDGLWKHRAAVSRRPRGIAPIEPVSQDSGEIAVLQDAGDLMTRANPLDLADVAVRFRSNVSGGYDVEQAPYGFRQPLGEVVTLTDDDTREMMLPFAFTFFNQQHDRVFVNSDGNLTFTEADTASTARSVSRFLTGPPRLAPLFADPRSVHRRKGARLQRCATVQRHVVRRSRVRPARDGHDADHAPCRWPDRGSRVGPDDDPAGGGRRVAGANGGFRSRGFFEPGWECRRRRRDRRAVYPDVRPRHHRREPSLSWPRIRTSSIS